jgi:hypothetical protein
MSMRHEDIKIGGVYLTRIGMNLCSVVVVSERTRTGRGKRGFNVRRTGSDTILSKKCTAAGLREDDGRNSDEPFGSAGARDMADGTTV